MNIYYLDAYIYTDYNSTIVVFVLLYIAGLINGFVFNIFYAKLMENPALIYNMMSLLITQLFIFSILYFFIDAIFYNNYVSFPYNLQGQNLLLNVSIILILIITSLFITKRLKFDIKILISIVSLAVIIYPMNYLELIIYGIFFGIIYLSKLIAYEKVIRLLNLHTTMSLIVLLLIFVSAIVYVLSSTQYLVIKCIYFILLLLICWIINNNLNFLRRNIS